MTNTSNEAMNTVAILEDLLETKKIDKASVKTVLKRLKNQIAQLGRESEPKA